MLGAQNLVQPATASSAKVALPESFLAKAAIAKTTEDWQKLAQELAPVVVDILNGTVKATAAQASLIKDIMDRAFGKPTSTQLEKRVAAGVIVLPALDDGMKKMICPKCGYDATKTFMEAESGSTNRFPKLDSERSDVRGSSGGREDRRADSSSASLGGPSETPGADVATDETAVAGSDRPDAAAIS